MFGRARSSPDLNIAIDGTKITRVIKYKYLGLVIDHNLTFNEHVNHIKKQVMPFISLMWRKGKYIPIDKRKQLYCAYVQSYCATYQIKRTKKLYKTVALKLHIDWIDLLKQHIYIAQASYQCLLLQKSKE